MSNQTEAVDRFLGALEHDLKEEIAALRAEILASNPEITERIKWNAPSFCDRGEDRVTFKLNRKDRVQLVFHRGAKVKDSQDFVFEDPSGLLVWAAADRAVVTLQEAAEMTAKREALVAVVNHWMERTR